MLCSIANLTANWLPSLINLFGAGIIAYGAILKLQAPERLNTFPPRQRLSDPQQQFMARAVEAKINDLIEWMESLTAGYTKSNVCIALGFALLVIGFSIDLLQKICGN